MSEWNIGGPRPGRRVGLVIASIFASLAPATAQSNPSVPDLPTTFTAATDAARGLQVEIVDAVTGAPIADAAFAWVRPVPKNAEGEYLPPRGVHWYEVSAAQHIGRREAFDARSGKVHGVLRIPLLPNFLFLRGQLQPAVAGVVDAPLELSLAPVFPATADVDPDGQFVLALRDRREAVSLPATIFGRTVTLSVPTEDRITVNLAPHQGIPVVDQTLALTLDARELAAAAFTQRRVEARTTPPRRAQRWPAAVDAGLAWLSTHQDEDGRWNADEFMEHDREGAVCDGPGHALVDVGVTALAVMAFLGNGHSPSGGRYAQTIRHGVQWLMAQRIKGDVVYATDAKALCHDFIYQHCMATIALCEASAAGGDPAWRPGVQRVVDYVEKHRNPYMCWRYQPRGNDNSMSVTLWAALALVAARDAGFTINPIAFEYALTYVNELTSSDGRTGYTREGEGSSRLAGSHASRFPTDRNETMTAAGLLLRRSLGEDPKHAKALSSAALLARRLPRRDKNAVDHYGWSLGTQALWLAGGDEWETWANAMTATAITSQRTDGNFAGSWDPVGVWGERGGRVYATAILVLGLESPWRLRRSEK